MNQHAYSLQIESCNNSVPYHQKRSGSGSSSSSINVLSKEHEKLSKYRTLARDFHFMYNMSVELVPVVLGYKGVVPGFTDILFSTLQKAVIFGTIYVLHMLLTCKF